MAALTLFCLPCYGGSLKLNSFAFDDSRFTVTEFAQLDRPLAMFSLADGSLAVGGYTAGIVRFSDVNHDGIADGAATTLYAAPGARLGLTQAGSYLIDSNFGT